MVTDEITVYKEYNAAVSEIQSKLTAWLKPEYLRRILNADDLDAAWTSLLESTGREDFSEQEIAQQLALT